MALLCQNTITAAWRDIENQKVFGITEVASALRCSISSARLKLKNKQSITSYNKNGKYYTLPGVPKFDQLGLWSYKDIYFSIHGNLKKTIIYLVGASSAGLSGKQLGELLRLSPQSFLHHFRDCPGIYREKHAGIFIYFSDNAEVNKKQIQQRRSLNVQSTIVTISDLDAVMILVAIISNHGITAEDIMAMPEIKRRKINLANIQGFMEYHGLVKKTPDTRL